MFIKKFKIIITTFLLLVLFNTSGNSEIINKITISGNDRIPDDTIKMFANVKISDDIDTEGLNQILNELYNTNFFENVSVNLEDNNLNIKVVEFPIIEIISYEGIKSNTIKDEITKNLELKPRSSFNSIILENDKQQITSILKNLGYFFSEINIDVETLDDNRVNINYNINLGDKAKIRKISFIGDKVFKDSKLRSVIISEEYKFWKFISGKKYLNQEMISLDQRLLKNFYLNKGYYDIEINSSFARLINDDEFELIYNINSNQKHIFNKLTLSIPSDFEPNNL